MIELLKKIFFHFRIYGLLLKFADFCKNPILVESDRKNFNFLKSKNGKAFFIGATHKNQILLQSISILSCKLKSMSVIVILSSPNRQAEHIYKSLGVDRFIYLYKLNFVKNTFKFNDSSLTKTKINDVLKIKYKGYSIGKIALSSIMRREKKSRFDFENDDKYLLNSYLMKSIKIIDYFEKLFNEEKPSLLFCVDKGYSPDGEICEVAFKKCIPIIECHVGYKSGTLLYKKFFMNNKNDHFASIDNSNWNIIKKQSIKKSTILAFFKELKECYSNGTWHDAVGTQFNKKIINRSLLVKKLDLNPKKKIAVLFSHIFWDATFFYGKDLFYDYQDWLEKSLKIMKKKPNINWIIKFHPAIKVKNIRDKKKSVGEEKFLQYFKKELPDNIKILDFNDEISTYSFFNIMDYCLTVRGTIGIEAATFGIPVITAGTGRYDGLGFTIDSQTIKEYESRLLNIEKIKRYSATKKKLAIKYASTLFFKKTLYTEFVDFVYLKNNSADIKISIPNHVKDFNIYKDISLVKKWIGNFQTDLLIK